jgi:hypothetical protein
MSWHEVLGLGRAADEREIKRAYAGLIRQFRPDSHPARFASIREAYEQAMREVKARAVRDSATPDHPVPLPTSGSRTENDGVAIGAATADSPTPMPLPADVPPSGENASIGQAKIAAPSADDPGPDSSDQQREPPFSTARWMAHIESALALGGEDAALQAFRAGLPELERLSIDEQIQAQDLLLQSFLHSDRPPMLAFMEARRRFSWEDHGAPRRSELGEWGARKQHFLLVASRIYLFARHSGNRFERALFEAQAGKSFLALRFGSYGEVHDARRLSATWFQACEAAGIPGVAATAHSRVSRHLVSGFMITSADLLFACLATWVIWGSLADGEGTDRYVKIGITIAIFFATLLEYPIAHVLLARFPFLGRMFDRLRRLRFRDAWAVGGLICAVILLMALSSSLNPDQMVTVFLVLGLTLLAGFGLLISWMILMLVMQLDYLVVSAPLRWMNQAHRYLLEQEVKRGPDISSVPTWGERVRAIPAFWRARSALKKHRDPGKRQRPRGGWKKPRRDLGPVGWIFLAYVAVSLIYSLIKNFF